MANPWENITFGSQRRIESNSPFNYFWIVDASGRYGMFIQTESELPRLDSILSLKGITLINRNGNTGHGELILIVNNNSDSELFLKVCTDLVRSSESANDEGRMIVTVYNRLRKWQAFLKQNNSVSLTLKEQMGLFTELDCLIEYVIPNHSTQQSMTSWTGPDFDKQDFSLTNKLVEVKSYISSKGSLVTISSLHQLDNSTKPLYLLVYGMTISSAGLSVPVMIQTIENILLNDPDGLEHFQDKLALYGYIDGITEPPFYCFQVDRRVAFFVNNDFPKITSASVSQAIKSVVYSVDILKCIEHQVEVNQIFKV